MIFSLEIFNLILAANKNDSLYKMNRKKKVSILKPKI